MSSFTDEHDNLDEGLQRRRRRPYQASGRSNLLDPLLPPPMTNSNRTLEDLAAKRRILDRDSTLHHHQSRGRWRIRHISRAAARRPNFATDTSSPGMRIILEWLDKWVIWARQFWNDWFHRLAHQKTPILILYLFLVYVGIVFMFAVIYLSISVLGRQRHIDPSDQSIHTDLFCDMDIHDPMEALYFALSTQATIGYGVSDYYFGGCWTPFILVLIQVWSALLFDAVAIGILFQRLRRGHKRSKTILFSRQAVARKVQGQWHFYVRLAELRHGQIWNPQVRAYCIRHERHPVAPNVAPAAENAAVELTAKEEKDDPVDKSTIQNPATTTESGLLQAATEIDTTHFVTKSVPLLFDAKDLLMSLPQVVVHRLDSPSTSPLLPPVGWYDAQGHQHPGMDCCSAEELQLFWRDRRLEVVLLLEGIDEISGSVLQTRHSYTVDDVAWNSMYVPCVVPFTETLRETVASVVWCGRQPDPVCVVDFARFHDVKEAPDDAPSCPYACPW